MIIAAPRIFRDGRLAGHGAVEVDGGVITRVIAHMPDDADIVLEHGILAPGLIDVHNNGAFGVDCAEAEVEDFRILCAALADCGVTSFLPTVITAPIAGLQAAAGRIDAAMAALDGAPGASILGLHLEGPFLAPDRRGAHRADWMMVPDAAALDALLADPALLRVLRLMTLAPELPGALAAIGRLVACGVVVALGHTDADAATAVRAIDAGARMATHVFTAMRPFHHRDPGIVGVALGDPRIVPCFIADAVHADPVSLRFGFAAAGRRAIAVTDSVGLAGMPEGERAAFGGDTVMVRDGAARRLDGTLAGATITLDEGVRRLIAAGVPAADALYAATEAPALALGLSDRGRLEAGLRADLVWFDDDFTVRNTWIGGVPIRAVTGRQHDTVRRLPATEQARTDLHDLDIRPSEAIVELLLAQEAKALAALSALTPALAALADAIAQKLEAGGRLFYAGAGTAGRLAVLDAVECGPTFSLAEGIIIPLIAGGDAAVTGAVENAEDDAAAAGDRLRAMGVGPGDALVGIAASGATRFTLGAVAVANQAGALTGCIVNSAGPIAGAVRHPIVIGSGTEILAGSTRLSAGTVQKIALNALSTTIMIRLGKSHGPYMVDLRANNAKLRDRAERIVTAIARCDATAARQALAACDFEVKTAIVMIVHGLGVVAARRRLGEYRRLRGALVRRK